MSLIATGSYAQVDQVKPPQIGIRVPLGEEAILKGTTIRFDKVLQDNRCPTSVDCVWAGQAIVQLTLTKEQGDKVVREITFKGGAPDPKGKVHIAKAKDYTLYAMALKPYPEKPGESLDYAVVVIAVKDQ